MFNWRADNVPTKQEIENINERKFIFSLERLSDITKEYAKGITLKYN